MVIHIYLFRGNYYSMFETYTYTEQRTLVHKVPEGVLSKHQIETSKLIPFPYALFKENHGVLTEDLRVQRLFQSNDLKAAVHDIFFVTDFGEVLCPKRCPRFGPRTRNSNRDCMRNASIL